MTREPSGSFSPARLERVEVMEDQTHPEADRGLFTVVRRKLVRNHYRGGGISRPYRLDIAGHRGTDAVGFFPFWEAEGRVWVELLRCFRPAQMFREREPLDPPFLIECVAGVLEEAETGEAGVRARAREEAMEEAGHAISEEEVVILGAPFFTSPGIYTEKVWVTAGRIDPARRTTPTHDGTVMEELIEILDLPLDTALSWCDSAQVTDAKTEIGLFRLARHLGRR